MQVLLERGELSERARLRVALDVLATIDPDAGSVDRRPDGSHLHVGRVSLDWSGEASIEAHGDTAGAAFLVWELLAGRITEASHPGRIHDLVDEIHPDVDDTIANALRGDYATVGELRDALDFAASGRIASRTDVVAELGPLAPLPPPRPLPPEQQAAIRASARPSARARATPPPSGRPIVATSEPPALAPQPTLTGARPLALRPPPSDLVAVQGPPSEPRPPPPSDPDPPSSVPSARPTVLLISMLEDEEGELVEELRSKGFAVAVVADAEAGFQATCQLEPSCVVCDVDLPDDSGDTVVRRLRKLPTAVSSTPFILVASPAATSDRIARFSAGADICLLKPYATSTVVAQVVALHHMSARLRHTRAALSRFPKASSRAFNGNLDQISLAAILTVVDMERRTGVFQIRHEATEVDLSIIGGHATHAVIQGRSVRPLEAMRVMVAMEKGRFSFIARDGFAAIPEDSIRVGHALAEATRLHDETSSTPGSAADADRAADPDTLPLASRLAALPKMNRP